MSERLKWSRGSAPRTFVAEVPGGVATIEYRGTAANRQAWRWSIIIEPERRSGMAQTQQLAADQVNTNWPIVADWAAKETARRLDEEWLAARLGELLAEGGDWSDIDVGGSSRERLIWINRQLGPFVRRETVKPLLAAISAELYRRRIQGQ